MEYVGEGGISDLRNRVYKRRGQVTLNGQGMATLVFDPPIMLERQPYLQLTPRTPANLNPVICNLVAGSFTTNTEGGYTGATIRGARMAGALPVMNPVSGLLGAVTNGVNAMVQALAGFKLIDAGAASDVPVDWLAF